ncbi:MerR family transcriptional regulator [Streptomyces sp. NPDC091281]|uniref:MerR family transcriptional regulator n=1 Tax=Streptomyces sp. NPDC091281 TaxID=3365985 RepID=UPI00382FB8FF
MRIGELAEAVGVTTRAVRHYHHLGLLPEPDRRANGYRDYTLRHAVALARIRRLTELGLGLAEVRDVLADDAGKDLVEVLTELDEDLARQEAALRERRARLRTLLDAEVMPAEGPVSAELAALFAGIPPTDSPVAAKDREMLALMDTAAGPAERRRMLDALTGILAAPGGVARAQELYRLMDDLADADPADPRVEAAARALVDCVPPELLSDVPEGGGGTVLDPDGGMLRALYADFPPAQAAAVRRALDLVSRRGGGR